MNKILTVLISLVLGVFLLQAAAFEKDAKARTTKIHISSDKPLSKGSNILILEIKKDGKILKNIKVSVKAFMPAMPGMPAMESKSDALDLENGKHEVKLNIPMRGTWQLHIFITPTQGKKSRVKTSINF